MNLATDLTSSTLLVPEDTAAPASIPAAPLTPREQARRYCLLLFLLPLFAVPAFIRLGASDFFLRHGASLWVQSNDAVFEMRDRSCDVLVYGDSTAMTGIDPEVVERNTGLKTCNIAVTNSVLAVTGNLTLDRYLEHNARPKVLLVQLSPDGFQPESRAWRSTVYPEGLVELLRRGSPAEARRALVTHPQESLAFAGYAAGFSAYAVLKEMVFRATRMRPEEDTVTIRNGFFTPPAPPAAACELDSIGPAPTGGREYPRRVVEQYERQYGSRAGMVLVNVAPIPACDQNLPAFSAELNGVTANGVTALPVGLFNDIRARHYTAVGSAVVSRLVAQQLSAVAGMHGVGELSSASVAGLPGRGLAR